MNFVIKSLVAAAVIASAGVASADVTTAAGGTFTLNGSQYRLVGGSGTLSFSESLISALNIGNVAVVGVEPATVTETRGPDPIFGGDVRIGSSAAAPITTVKTSDAGAVLTVSTAGGAKMVASPSVNISLGGELSVTNLAVDLSNKRIYASITGNFSGVGTAGGIAPVSNTTITTKDNFYLWDFANISGPTTVTGAGAYNNTITGLKITTAGYQHFVSALRLYSTGAATLTTVTDYGSIASTINVQAIPEPSTYALMGLGLVGIAVAARRRAK